MASLLPQPGEVFADKYRLERVLGEGAFGRVFEGRDETLDRPVAIKVLKPTGSEHEVRRTQRFLREMQVIAKLSHPNIVVMYDYGRSDDGLWFMVFERVGGKDLAEILAEGPLDEPTTLRILRQLLEALEVAHAQNVLHRDIKPENIRIFRYLDDPWRVKLLDFGLATNTDEDSRLTGTGKVVGTPRFMAPEQLRGRPLTAASDIYSLGLVAYEMLTGTKNPSLENLANSMRVRLPEELDVREGTRRTIDRMLEVNPAGRFQSVGDALRHLERGPDRADADGDATRRHVRPPTGGVPRQPERPDADDGARRRRDRPPTGGVPTQPSRAERGRRSPPPGPAASPMRRRVWPFAAIAVASFLVVLTAGLVWRGNSADRKVQNLRPELLAVRPADPTAAPGAPSPKPAPARRSAQPVPADTGCGAPIPFRGFGSLEKWEGLSKRHFAAFIPDTYRTDRPAPLVVLLHDAGHSASTFLRESGFDRVSTDAGFIVVAPVVTGLGVPVTRASTPSALQRERPTTDIIPADDRADDLKRTIEDVRDLLCIDSQRIYAVGHGQGAWLAELATCAPSEIDAIATTSYRGVIPAPCRRVPHLQISPKNTARMPIDGGDGSCSSSRRSLAEKEADWRQRNACADEPRTYESSLGECQTWSCAAPFVSCQVRGGYHWPGVSPETDFMFTCNGPMTRGDFAEPIWRFFESLTPADPPATTR